MVWLDYGNGKVSFCEWLELFCEDVEVLGRSAKEKLDY